MPNSFPLSFPFPSHVINLFKSTKYTYNMYLHVCLHMYMFLWKIYFILKIKQWFVCAAERLHAEHFFERTFFADIIDAIDPIPATIGLPEWLSGLRAAAAVKQRNGKTHACRLYTGASSASDTLDYSRLQCADTPHRDGCQEMSLAQYHFHPLNVKPALCRSAGWCGNRRSARPLSYQLSTLPDRSFDVQ